MRSKYPNKAAFTLVELLAAMAVLSIMLLMFGNIFSTSGKAWSHGTRQTEQNMSGRAVLEYMCKEIGQAIANTNGVVFQNIYPGNVPGNFSALSYDPATPNTALHFVTLRRDGNASTPDEARLVHYYVAQDASATDYKNFQLMRAQCTDTVLFIPQAYTMRNPSWLTTKGGSGWTASVFADHVTQFYVVANGNIPTYKSDNPPGGFKAGTLPQYVDIVLGFISEDDARRASLLTGKPQLDYITKAEKRFTRRVYLQNRTGYMPLP